MAGKKTAATAAKVRHPSIPANAFWVDADERWETGAKKNGKEVGTWRVFRDSGELECIQEFGDRSAPCRYDRFHPDGSFAQSGEWDFGANVPHGLVRWQRASGASPEDAAFPASSPNVRAAEYLFDMGWVLSERYFGKGNGEVAGDGTRLPKRPKSVDPRAFFAAGTKLWCHHERRWHDDTGRILGTSTHWDERGTLLTTRVFEPEGVLQERRDYSKGGKIVFRVRREQVAPLHVRRWFNDGLAFECILPSRHQREGKQIRPVVRYMDERGTVIIRYQPTKLGEGRWQLLDARGREALSIDVHDETSKTELYWERFLPELRQYIAAWSTFEPDYAREQFNADWQSIELPKRVVQQAASLDCPEIAGASKIHWHKLFEDRAAAFAKEFPNYLRALTLADSDSREHAKKTIAQNLECQGAIEEATPVAIPFLVALLLGKREPASFGAIAFVLELIASAVAFPEVKGDPFIRASRAAFRKCAKDLERAAKTAPRAHRKVMRELLASVDAMRAAVEKRQKK